MYMEDYKLPEKQNKDLTITENVFSRPIEGVYLSNRQLRPVETKTTEQKQIYVTKDLYKF